MHVVIFGANGPTGRLLTARALAAGHQVTAVTRHPGDISPRIGLRVAYADATDAGTVSAAVAGSDAVLSALGVPYSRRPVSLYSAGTAGIITAMRDHGIRRLVVASTAAADPGYHASDSAFFTRVMEPLFMRSPGRTVYDDNRRMEAVVQGSGLDWTIVRACWLFNSAGVSEYQTCEGSPHGMFTARADLAACLLAQLTSDRTAGTTIGVRTVAGTPSIPAQIWREVINRGKRN
jgi:nucleoside-diphosphate-sugar epimerase